MCKCEKKSICIISFSLGKTGTTPLENLINNLSKIFDSVHVISFNEPLAYFTKKGVKNIYGINHPISHLMPIRIFNFVSSQLKISYKMLILRKQIDYWLFFVELFIRLFVVLDLSCPL